MHSLISYKEKIHRLIPSKFPPVSIFDWAESEEELEQIAMLEGLTNDRILAELGAINLIPRNDWVLGPGSTPLMSAFIHTGFSSRFSDGSFGVYYAATTLEAAIQETVYHRSRFYKASGERPCSLSMRQYISRLQQPLVNICDQQYQHYLQAEPEFYPVSQDFGRKIREENQWGLYYPSIRKQGDHCMAVFRPSALSIPTQGCHLKYIWDGATISDVFIESKIA